MHAVIAGKLDDATGVKAALVAWARSVGEQYHALVNRGLRPGRRLSAQHRLAERLIYHKVKSAIGLGRARLCVTGAAPIDGGVLRFFAGLDLVIREVYGQSEDCGPTSFNLPGATRFGTVGRPVAGVEVRLDEDGEIMVRVATFLSVTSATPRPPPRSCVTAGCTPATWGRSTTMGF